jgi:hypothetical protein
MIRLMGGSSISPFGDWTTSTSTLSVNPILYLSWLSSSAVSRCRMTGFAGSRGLLKVRFPSPFAGDTGDRVCHRFLWYFFWLWWHANPWLHGRRAHPFFPHYSADGLHLPKVRHSQSLSMLRKVRCGLARGNSGTRVSSWTNVAGQ